MRHPYFHRAVMEAYEPLIPSGDQISYFIYLEVDPSSIDVNIHPTKTEIKFESEQAIWQILAATVKETLGRHGGVPSIDFDTEGMPDIPSFNGGVQSMVEPPQVNFNPNFNPFNNTRSSGTSSSSWNSEPSSALISAVLQPVPALCWALASVSHCSIFCGMPCASCL